MLCGATDFGKGTLQGLTIESTIFTVEWSIVSGEAPQAIRIYEPSIIKKYRKRNDTQSATGINRNRICNAHIQRFDA